MKANCTRILPTRNGSFRVAVTGDPGAPVLMLSNSLGTTLEMWDSQVASFSSTHRVVCYDTRGHGASSVSPGPYSFEQLGDDVVSILDALEVDKAAFCGISMGGHTGLWLALNAPQRLKGVALCNSAAQIGNPDVWLDRAKQVRKDQKKAMRRLAETAPERWFTKSFVQNHTSIVSTAQGWLANTDPEGYASCCEALSASDLRPKLKTINLPVLLVAGSHDEVTTPTEAREMHQAIPASSLATIEASHLSNLEAASELERILANWLEKL